MASAAREGEVDASRGGVVSRLRQFASHRAPALANAAGRAATHRPPLAAIARSGRFAAVAWLLGCAGALHRTICCGVVPAMA
jgi:hypothetical protein